MENGLIYGAYKDDELIYVGSTTSLARRQKEHMGSKNKDKFHAYLKEPETGSDAGLTPKIEFKVIKKHPCQTRSELLAAERKEIRKHLDEGKDLYT